MTHRYRVFIEDLDEDKILCHQEVDLVFVLTSNGEDTVVTMKLYDCPKTQYMNALCALNNMTVDLNSRLSRQEMHWLKQIDKKLKFKPVPMKGDNK